VLLVTFISLDGGGYYIGESARYPGTFLLERAAKIVRIRTKPCSALTSIMKQSKPVVYVALNYRFGLYGCGYLIYTKPSTIH
jgi:carboxylesterase type B